MIWSVGPLVVASVSLALAPQPAALEAVLSGARCEAVVRRQLVEWHVDHGAARPDPPGPLGLRSLRVPTDALGLWVRVAEEVRGTVAVERITATRVERLRFDAECAAEESAVAMPPRPADAVTDAEIIGRAARGDRGVFLLWSPHMPLSVDQHAALAAVAGEMGLVVVPLLDPAADARYAERVARERSLPTESLRPLGGIELAFRGMTTHTPSLQVFAGGTLRGPVLYGYRGPAALRHALDGVLNGR